jgi:hypothetical protein
MYLTLDILKKNNACGQGVDWFSQNYPDGAELIDVIRDKRVATEFLHWGYQHLSINEAEYQAYLERLQIEVEKPWTIYEGRIVKNSEYVSKSERVTNSSFVFGSKQIKDSHNVNHSKMVERSEMIYNSFLIDNSKRVLDSKNITDSANVICSDFVVGSYSIFNGSMITDSGYVNGFSRGSSRDITESFFIMSCKNLRHCLFCEGISDKEYHLFNKPITPKLYEVISKQLWDILEGRDLTFTKEWPENTVPLDTPRVQRNLIKQHKDLPDEFWDWVKTLPNYDPTVLYGITFQSDKISD